MKFIIIGANGETGLDVNITVDAQNAEEARLQANALGILVSSIVPADILNPSNAMTNLNPTPIAPPNPTPAPAAKPPTPPQPTPAQPAAATPAKPPATAAAAPQKPTTTPKPATPSQSTPSAKPSFFRAYRVPLIIGGVLVGGLAFIILVTVIIVGVVVMKPKPKPAYSSYSSSSGSSYNAPPAPPPVPVETAAARTTRRTIECWNATIAINNSLSRLATDNRTEYWGQMIERYSNLDTTDVAPEVQTYINDWLDISRGYYTTMTDYNRKCAAIRKEVQTARDTAYRMSKPENAELAANIAELAALAMYDADQKKYDAAYRSAINSLDSRLTTFNGNVKSVQRTLTAKYGIQF